MRSTPRLTIHVVGAAILRDSRCLVAQRGAEMDFAMKWEFPGGKIEPGENPQEALSREVREELGVVIEVGAHLGRGEGATRDRHILLDVYEALLISGEPASNEHHALRWSDVQEIAELDFAEADRPIIAPLLARLLQSS